MQPAEMINLRKLIEKEEKNIAFLTLVIAIDELFRSHKYTKNILFR